MIKRRFFFWGGFIESLLDDLDDLNSSSINSIFDATNKRDSLARSTKREREKNYWFVCLIVSKTKSIMDL